MKRKGRAFCQSRCHCGWNVKFVQWVWISRIWDLPSRSFIFDLHLQIKSRHLLPLLFSKPKSLKSLVKIALSQSHLRQFYSLAADLEKTRQALLIATVSPIIAHFHFSSTFHHGFQEKGDFSRLPKKMGHVYSMAMIRWVSNWNIDFSQITTRW